MLPPLQVHPGRNCLISLLLKAMFSSVTTLSDGMLRAQGKLDSSEDLRKSRVVLNLRKRLIGPVFHAWRELQSRHKELRIRTLRRATQRGRGCPALLRLPCRFAGYHPGYRCGCGN